MRIVDEIITIRCESLPPKNSFIEAKILQHGIEPIRWAIIKVEDNTLTLSVAGIKN